MVKTSARNDQSVCGMQMMRNSFGQGSECQLVKDGVGTLFGKGRAARAHRQKDRFYDSFLFLFLNMLSGSICVENIFS